jgi:hypothetical protein
VSIEEIKRKIATDPDFVALKRFGFSLKKVVERYPDGAPTKIVAQALLMEEAEVEEIYRRVVLKLREEMKVSL